MSQTLIDLALFCTVALYAHLAPGASVGQIAYLLLPTIVSALLFA